MMIRLIAIAVLFACVVQPAEARKPVSDPARFLCANLKIACSKHAPKQKRQKPPKKTAKAPAKPVAKPAAKPVAKLPGPAPAKPVAKPAAKPVAKLTKPAPAKPLSKSEPPPPPKRPESQQEQAVVAPAKPVQKPSGTQVVAPPSVGPPPADEGAACRAELERLGAEFEIPRDFEPGPGCSVANPVELKSLRTRNGSISLPGRPTLNCVFARQFLTWLGDVAGPVVAAHEDSSLAALSTGPGFQCRGRNGEASAKLSEHAFGNAIDIDGLVTGSKKRIEIAAVSDPASPAYRVLMALRVSACGYFTTVLGPGANAAHASHYHFDLGIHGKSANYRICE
jgi:hypothetical protein